MARSRRWCFTLNNPEDEQCGGLILGETIRGLVYQLEQGLNGTRHLQGYVEFTVSTRLGGLKTLLPRAHWEQARGTSEQAQEYCKKAESRLDGPWIVGTFTTNQGKRSDLAEIATKIRDGTDMQDIAEDHGASYIRYSKGIQALWSIRQRPRMLQEEPFCCFIFGPTGVGKTRDIASLFRNNVYWKDTSKWWDGYLGEHTIVWDDFRGSCAAFSTMLRLVDRYPCRTEYKGGSIHMQAMNWIFTSNKAPWRCWAIQDQDPWFRRINLVIYRGENGEVRWWNTVLEAKAAMPFYFVHEGDD